MNERSSTGKSKPERQVTMSIGVPSGEVWQAAFGLDLATLCAHFGFNRLPGYDAQRLRILTARSSMISQNRENLVRLARKNGSSHLLFLDSDMEFPADTMHRLLRHDKEIVAANCVIKQIPTSTTAILPDGNRLYTNPDSEGLVRVEKVGVAVALIRLDVFDKISRPWFHMEWNDDLMSYMGEDIYFCLKCKREANIPIYVDQDLSREVKHVGAYSFDHSMVGTFAGKRFHEALPAFALHEGHKDATNRKARRRAAASGS